MSTATGGSSQFTREQLAAARRAESNKQKNHHMAEASKQRSMVIAGKRNGTKFLRLAEALMEQPVRPRKRPEAIIPKELSILVNAKVSGEGPRLYNIPADARMTWFGGQKKELTVSWGTVCLQFRAVNGGLKLICPSGYTEGSRAVRHDTVGNHMRASAPCK